MNRKKTKSKVDRRNSSVSSPILACSDFTSTAGVAGVPPPGPKISEALASSCDFHVAIWLGWTSKCSAKAVPARFESAGFPKG